MKNYLLYPCIAAILLGCIQESWAQTAKGVAIPLRLEYPASGRGIIIKWPKDASFVSVRVRRRLLDSDFAFYEIQNGRPVATLVGDTSAIDTTYRPGMLAEYVVTMTSARATGGNYTRSGELAVCRDCPPTGFRGKMILVVEKMIKDSLAAELTELQQDLRADGWLVRTVHVQQTDAVTAVRDSIFKIYSQDSRTKMVYLLGHVPIPYSGNTNPDGHATHRGAWSADGYYVSFSTNFTDASVNNSTADRPENKNVPGDGKFDQSSISEVQPPLGICRVSLHNLPVFTLANPAFTETYITRRYLQKAHLYKTGQYVTNGGGLMDDNYDYFNGESFATAGWLSMNACIGQTRVFEHPYDLLFDSRTRNWLMGYGCGGGGYEACLDVGNSRNFAGDRVNVVFMQLFGSYFGDWDSQDNLMRSALGSLGGVLTCSWSGRPYHHYHLMGMGKPFGETARINLFNNGQALLPNRSAQSVSIGFMGDPSLRLRYFKPPTELQAIQSGNGAVRVRWHHSADTVSGYHLYRATSDTGVYERITQAPVQDTIFQDAVSPGGRYYYMVRAVQVQGYPGGSYVNQSLGITAGPVAMLTRIATGMVPLVDLYPNPTEGMVKIESSDRILAVQVLDGLGRMVQNMPAATRSVQVDLGSLPKGVYSIKVQAGGVWQVRRVVRL